MNGSEQAQVCKAVLLSECFYRESLVVLSSSVGVELKRSEALRAPHRDLRPHRDLQLGFTAGWGVAAATSDSYQNILIIPE